MRIFPLLLLLLLATGCQEKETDESDDRNSQSELGLDQDAIVNAADELLSRAPVTVTSFTAERSAGGLHDYYSEGRYWWPDEGNPDGPYVRKDGQANPQNFSGHQMAMIELSKSVTTLTAAYTLTGEEKYARKAIEHLQAWFVNPATIMNPNMLYGQAIKGITTGRGIGIIDALRLIDVALSIELLRRRGVLSGTDDERIKQWFSEFGKWLTTHPYGVDEMKNGNNHSTWWGAQIAAYARAAGGAAGDDLLRISRQQFQEQLPIQVAVDGGFPEELRRTIPFHYINYNLDAWGIYAALISDQDDNYWNHEFTTRLPSYQPDSPGAEDREDAEPRTFTLEKVINYAVPYLDSSAEWPYPTELEREIHPQRYDYLVFAWWGLGDKRFLDLWKDLDDNDEYHHANLVLWQELRAHD